MKNKYDIIIIGSGIGGLVSASLLCQLDKKVLIIEKEPKAGGYLTEFKNNGFTFDVSLHLLNGAKEGGYAYEVFKKCGIIKEVKFLRPKYLYRSVFPDFDISIPQIDVNAFKEKLIDMFPKSENGIKALFDEMKNVYTSVNNYINLPKETSTMALVSYIKSDFETLIDKHISDIKLKAIICQLWIYFGLPPSSLRAIDFCYPWFDYLTNGGYYIERGSYAIIRALMNHIRHNGGEFLFNAKVGRIMVENGLCKSVAFEKNNIFCDTLISNADITRTVYELIGAKEFNPDTLEKLKAIEPSISAFEVFLGLDVDLGHIYPDDYEIFVNSGYDLEEQYQASLANNAKTAPFVITINSNVNKFSAGRGKSVVSIIMLAGYDHWISRTRSEYQDKKQKIADILVKRATSIIPDISGHIQKEIISTPVTFERYTNNLRGAIYGYARTNNRIDEAMPNNLKKIKNLFFASAWARQGSGIVKVLRSADDVFKKIQNTVNNKTAVVI